jgi:AcrR family transcriptional regulator
MTTTWPATPAANPLPRSVDQPRTRAAITRARIMDAAMRHFAEYGFQDARASHIADNLGIAKASVVQHFGSKTGLFFETYKKAVRSFPSYNRLHP